MKPIENVEDIKIVNHKVWRRLGSASLLLGVMCATIAGLLIKHPSWLGVVIPLMILLAGGYGWYESVRREGLEEEKQKEMFFDQIADLPSATLIQTTQSPELSARTRDIIIAYLNEKHPGWSFNNPRESA